MDEQQRGRVRDDLQGFFKGELHVDSLSRTLYSTDASIFQVQPLGVASRATRRTSRAWCATRRRTASPLVPRGAGTGLAGESLGRGSLSISAGIFARLSMSAATWSACSPA